MIPLKLQLKNFMSYGAQLQEIDFTPYNLICLSGRNGHGKSALLDAITWAVWGHARKAPGSPKADQGVLRLGTNNMMVLFEFEFNGNRYRIRREVTFTYSKPYVLLDFGMYDTDDSLSEASLISLTDKTIRSTQLKIETMIGLDYETYINSAFLRQGHANEFSKKTPKERKEILGSVLGLDTFEVLKKKGLEKAKALQADKKGLSRLLEHMSEKLERIVTVKEEHARLMQQFEQGAVQEKEQDNEEKKLEKIEKKLKEQAQALAILLVKQEQVQKQEQETISQRDQARSEWKQIHKTRIEAKDHHALKQKKVALEKELDVFNQKQQKLLVLKEKELQTKTEMHNIVQELQAKLHNIVQKKQTEINDCSLTFEKLQNKCLEIESGNKELVQNVDEQKKQILVVQKQAGEATVVLATKDAFQKRFEKRRETYQRFISMYNSRHRELQELARKQGFSHNEDNPSCPLCEQNLSASRKRFLKTKLEKEHHWLTCRLTRLQQLITTLKSELLDEHKELQRLVELEKQAAIEAMKLKEFQTSVQKINNELKHRNTIYNVLQKDVVQKKAELKRLQAYLAKAKVDNQVENSKPYVEVKTQLGEVEKEATALKYDKDAHQRLDAQLAALNVSIDKIKNLDQQIALQGQKLIQIVQLHQVLKQHRKQLATFTLELESFSNLTRQQGAYDDDKKALKRQQQEYAQAKEKLVQEKGQLDNELARLNAMAKEHQAHQKTMGVLDTSIEEYKAIIQAFGKDGIQALLIEDAIPEIEQEANELLARLTDNQAQLFIESLRDLKDGGTKETLDIKISDAAGLRPYEMFSGGEAFRIDFALRIAISKLLARRAGTSLQTLIIDEGFGSQDEEGLTHIMDALHKIQEDFAKIIIVSHLPSMKEQFPVHFHVEKQALGSLVSIIEQG